MRKGLAVGVISLAVPAALVLLAQSSPQQTSQSTPQITPLSLSTGQWQTTLVLSYAGLPPQMEAALNQSPAKTYTNCVKPEDLTSDAWAKGVIGKCSSVTVLNSTGTDTDVEAADCEAGNGMTAAGHGKFHLVDSQHLTGTMDVTFSGGGGLPGNTSLQMHGVYTSKWVAATCPAGM